MMVGFDCGRKDEDAEGDEVVLGVVVVGSG